MLRRFRPLLISICLVLFSFVVWVGRVEATDGLQGDECIIAVNEVILEDFYFACNTLVIDGYVDGDIIGIASEVTIGSSGRVTGDVWMVGGQLTIEGEIGNDVHFAGADLDITGLARMTNPDGDIVAVGISLEISRHVVVPSDVIFYGYQAILDGKINGNIDFQGQSLTVGNAIAGQVDAIVANQDANAPLSSLPLVYSVDFEQPGLHFRSADEDDNHIAFIRGDLNYEAPQRLSVRDFVGGRVRYTQSISRANITSVEQSETFLQIFGNYILVAARDSTALGLIGILMMNFASKSITEPGYRVHTRPISAFSWGVILFLVSIPITLIMIVASLLLVLIVAVITISELTLMISLILLVLNLGLVSFFFFLFWYLGRVISAFVIGFITVRLIQKLWLRYRDDTPPPVLSEIWLSILVGVIVVSLVVNMPLGPFFGVIQFFVTGALASAGLGALFIYLRDAWYKNGGRTIITRRATGSVSPINLQPIPPPPPDDDETDLGVPLGMDNLPPGFKGFDD